MKSVWRRLFRKQQKSGERGPRQEKCDGLVFECRDVRLGREATCNPGVERFSIYIHCSERDGLAWQFKCTRPYAIRCSFSDGGYCVNDPTGFDYSPVLSQLLALHEDWEENRNETAFRELQEITARFVKDYFTDQHDLV